MDRYSVQLALPPSPDVRRHASEALSAYKACCQILLRYAIQDHQLPRRLQPPVTVHLRYRLKKETLVPRGRAVPADPDSCWLSVRPILEAMADMGLVPAPEDILAGQVTLCEGEEETVLILEIEEGGG